MFDDDDDEADGALLSTLTEIIYGVKYSISDIFNLRTSSVSP